MVSLGTCCVRNGSHHTNNGWDVEFWETSNFFSFPLVKSENLLLYYLLLSVIKLQIRYNKRIRFAYTLVLRVTHTYVFNLVAHYITCVMCTLMSGFT